MIVANEVSEEDAFSHFQWTLLLLFWSYCHGNKGIEPCVFYLPTRTILSLSAMSSRHWIDRGAVGRLVRPNAWSILVWIVRTSSCSHQKGICALLCAAAAHAVVCNAFFSFSQVLWEEKARETLRSFTSWDSSCPLRSGETICLIFRCNLSKEKTHVKSF